MCVWWGRRVVRGVGGGGVCRVVLEGGNVGYLSVCGAYEAKQGGEMIITA